MALIATWLTSLSGTLPFYSSKRSLLTRSPSYSSLGGRDAGGKGGASGDCVGRRAVTVRRGSRADKTVYSEHRLSALPRLSRSSILGSLYAPYRTRVSLVPNSCNYEFVRTRTAFALASVPIILLELIFLLRTPVCLPAV